MTCYSFEERFFTSFRNCFNISFDTSSKLKRENWSKRMIDGNIHSFMNFGLKPILFPFYCNAPFTQPLGISNKKQIWISFHTNRHILWMQMLCSKEKAFFFSSSSVILISLKMRRPRPYSRIQSHTRTTNEQKKKDEGTEKKKIIKTNF